MTKIRLILFNAVQQRDIATSASLITLLHRPGNQWYLLSGS